VKYLTTSFNALKASLPYFIMTLITIWEPQETITTRIIRISIGLSIALWKVPLLVSLGLFETILAIRLIDILEELR